MLKFPLATMTLWNIFFDEVYDGSPENTYEQRRIAFVGFCLATGNVDEAKRVCQSELDCHYDDATVVSCDPYEVDSLPALKRPESSWYHVQ